jgi:dihydrofolate synthase/folylpolyglutamate synthase
MTFDEAVRFLNSLIDYEKRVPGKYDTGTYNLDAFRHLVDRTGRPDRDFASIHVAGTDGKGSTCAFAESILRHAGLRTGFYSSPHISSYLERIRLDGKPIRPDAFGSLVAEIRDTLEEIRRESGAPSRRGFATVFEILTAAAFLAFSRERVDVALVEVGLGGRLDATNVVTPDVSVITPVDRDHTHLLGATPAEIAREKGGIIKPGVPVVLAPQAPEVRRVLEHMAAERGSPVVFAPEKYRYVVRSRGFEGYEFDLEGPGGGFSGLFIAAAGGHQVSNARTAVVAAGEFLRGRGAALGEDAVRAGLSEARWAGRCEPVLIDPGDGTRLPAILDCSHTTQAGRALRATLDEISPDTPLVFLLGLAADKLVDDYLRELLRPGDAVVTTRSDSPRSMAPQELAERAKRAASAPEDTIRVTSTENWEEGLLAAARKAREEGRSLCAAGSIYLVGLVRSRSVSAQTE